MRDWRIAIAAAVGTAALIGTAQAITDTTFTYSTPRTGFLGINPTALASLDSSNAYSNTVVQLTTTGSPSCFGTGINLPQGAKVVTIVVWYKSGAGTDPIVLFSRQRY